MTISVTDSQTGKALTVLEVQAALGDRQDEDRRTPWCDAIEAQLHAERGHSFAELIADTHGMIAAARSRMGELGIADGVAAELPFHTIDLPPDPALELAPEALDADQAARDARAEQRRRAAVLEAVGQRPRFVPQVPAGLGPSRWRRVKAGVAGYLAQVGAERAL